VNTNIKLAIRMGEQSAKWNLFREVIFPKPVSLSCSVSSRGGVPITIYLISNRIGLHISDVPKRLHF